MSDPVPGMHAPARCLSLNEVKDGMKTTFQCLLQVPAMHTPAMIWVGKPVPVVGGLRTS